MRDFLRLLVRTTMAGAVCVVLAGCGFQLRGAQDAALPTAGYGYSLAIQTTIPGFRLKLANSLRSREFIVGESEADFIVEAINEDYNEDDFELTSLDLALRSKTLYYTIEYRLKSGDGIGEDRQGEIMLETDYTRLGSNELARDTSTRAALERTRQQAADLIAERLVELITLDEGS